MIIIFAGPTIGASQVRDILPEADVRPPARTGDVYAACQSGASAIGLIDGYFEGVPSVWHKEILWALDQGILVFGASSMGALRAAEMAAFGMIGVGSIFEAYADGTLEDDDEVALRHGPAEVGYVALSEPMVNIRATLEHAVVEGILDRVTADLLTGFAKEVHFSERSWEGLLRRTGDQPAACEGAERLQQWLPTGRVDQKRRDAVAMLSAMANPVAHAAPREVQSFVFQHTVMWENLMRQHENAEPTRDMVLAFDQLRRHPEKYQDLRMRVADNLGLGRDIDVLPRVVDRAVTEFRTQNRLFTGAALNAWLAEQHLDLNMLRQGIAQRLMLRDVAAQNIVAFKRSIIQASKAEGAWDDVHLAAQKVAGIFDRAGFHLPTIAELDISAGMLLIWYFEDWLERMVPHDLDGYLQDNDFADRSEFEQMMARAYVLWQNSEE